VPSSGGDSARAGVDEQPPRDISPAAADAAINACFIVLLP
jgi:hypothetical protein